MILAFVIVVILILSFTLIASSRIKMGFFLESICRVKTDSYEVALTFDDGPHPEYTPELLDLLKENHITATFFVIGTNAEKYPEIVKRIAAEGHTIGIHSYYHKPSFTFLSKQYVINDLKKSKTLLEKITGKEILLFRPPYGVTNPNIAYAVKLLNLQSVGWCIRSYDTVKKSENNVVRKIERSLSPGSIILMHDRLPGCVSLVSRLLTILDNNGYKAVSL